MTIFIVLFVPSFASDDDHSCEGWHTIRGDLYTKEIWQDLMNGDYNGSLDKLDSLECHDLNGIIDRELIYIYVATKIGDEDLLNCAIKNLEDVVESVVSE